MSRIRKTDSDAPNPRMPEGERIHKNYWLPPRDAHYIERLSIERHEPQWYVLTEIIRAYSDAREATPERQNVAHVVVNKGWGE